MIDGHKISFCNQVYNEPEAIRRYLNSCLYFDDVVDEVFVINHRSSDDTLSIIESFIETYENSNIKLRLKTEPRDFNRNFLIADLFGDAVAGCENEIVFRHDADFVFGAKYVDLIKLCVSYLSKPEVYACGYEIPCVSQSLEIKNDEIVSFGLCNLHEPVPRVFKKSKTVCRQDHMGGKYEYFYPTDTSCTKFVGIPNIKESIISINIRSKERHALRQTMNTFMHDLLHGKTAGDWLQVEEKRGEVEPWAVDTGSGLNITGWRFYFKSFR